MTENKIIIFKGTNVGKYSDFHENQVCVTQIKRPGKLTINDFDLSTITDKDLYDLMRVINEYPDIWAVNDYDIGEGTPYLEYRLDLIDDIPVHSKPYRVPYYLQGAMQSKINELLNAGIIEPSTSPYSAPVMLLKRSIAKNPEEIQDIHKDRDLDMFRIVVDFRQLNKKMIPDRLTLPNQVELLTSLGTAKIFTTLDLKKGFYCVNIKVDDKFKTGFSTPNFHGQFRKMP